MRFLTHTGMAVLAVADIISCLTMNTPPITLDPVVEHAMLDRQQKLRKRGISERDIYGEMKAFKLTDPEQMCTAPFSNSDEALETWWRTGAGDSLDSWIKMRTEGGADGKGTNWWNYMMSYLWNGTQAPLDCTTFTGGGCEVPPDLCRELVAQGKGPFYWIVKQVATMNLGYTNLHEQYLQNGAIENGLDIPQFIKDFTPDPVSKDDTPTVWGYIASILLLAGSTVTLGNGGKWGTLVGMFGSLFGLVDKWKPEEEETEFSLENVVSEYFKNAEANSLTAMHNMIGKGNQQDIAATVFSMDYYYQSPTAKAFADGKFLISDVGVYMDPMIKEAKRLMNLRLALYTLQQQGMWLQIQATSDFGEKGCTAVDKDNSWIDGQCMHFQMPGHDTQGTPNGGKRPIPKEMDSKFKDKLVNDYKINWKDVHQNAYDCAKSSGDKKMDTNKLPVDGSLPACYFAIDMKKGTWDGSGGEDDGKWDQDKEWKVDGKSKD
ncbi:hypothetical protein F4778DRAFT_667614 [Xylariomycetidae sp. FL2044]|nr:hypothetical protein F4778DRAFT_667614 [Xylariomycetidae sp. FL2044]